jgi:CelD/BcsL family acetyltransferase involved in cellulose biosynthesis
METVVFSAFTPELEEIWREFETEADFFPFQSCAWLLHWQNTVGNPLHCIRPQIVVLRNEKEIMAIFPMGIRKTIGVSILEWLGGEHTDYLGPLLNVDWWNMEVNFMLCWENILKILPPFDVIHLQKQQEYIGDRINPFIQIKKTKIHLHAYNTTLCGSWEEHMRKRVKTKLLTDSSRQRRRLNKSGELKFVVAKDSTEKEEIISKMINQKRQRYKETGVSDMLSVLEHRNFYMGITDIPEGYLKIHCSALFVGDTAIATHFGVYDENVFYYMMPGHDTKEWARYSPGRLLLEYLIEWSIENKLSVFDFTVGGELYKHNWCDRETNLYEYVRARTFKGHIYENIEEIKRIVKNNDFLARYVRNIILLVKQ